MSRHVLVITGDTPETRDCYLECPDGNGCSGWIECGVRWHGDGERSAEHGPFDCSDDLPWYDEEEYEFHGETHTWRSGYGWTVPYRGCVVMYGNWEPPDDVFNIEPGRYDVEDDWDETEVYLEWANAE